MHILKSNAYYNLNRPVFSASHFPRCSTLRHRTPDTLFTRQPIGRHERCNFVQSCYCRMLSESSLRPVNTVWITLQIWVDADLHKMFFLKFKAFCIQKLNDSDQRLRIWNSESVVLSHFLLYSTEVPHSDVFLVLKYFPQHPLLKHPQSALLHYCATILSTLKLYSN